MAVAYVSQDVIELLSLPTPAARLTQDVIEVLGTTVSVVTPGRITQDVIEVVSAVPGPAVRMTQAALELFVASPAATRTTQVAVEVFLGGSRQARMTQAALELFVASAAATHTTQIAVEVFTPYVPVPVPPTLNPGWLAWVEWPADAEEATRRHDVRRRARPPRSGPPWPVVAYSDWDLQDPPAYYHGFKQARVERFGEATRTLSEPRTGDWQGSACSLRLSDFDRRLRTMLASDTERYWTVGNFILRMVTRQTRAALEEALTVFVGPLRRADPVPPLSMELLLEDSIGHTMLDDEHLIPQRVIDADDWVAIPDLVEAAKGHPVPIIYGTHVRPGGAFAPIYLGIEGNNHVWLVAGHYARVLDVFVDGIGVTGADPADWTLPGWSGPVHEEIAGRRYTLLRGRKGTPASVTDPVLYAENAGALEDYVESWIAGVTSSDLFFPDPAARWDVTATTDPRTGTRHILGTGLLEADTALGYFRLAGDPDPPAYTAYFINDYTSLVLYLKNGTLGWGDAELRLRFAVSGEDLVMLGVWVTLSDGLYGLDTFDTTTWQTITIPVEDFEIDETLPVNRLWIYKAGEDAIDVAIDDISFTGGAEVEAVLTPADEAARGMKALTVNVSGWTTTGDDTGLVLAAIADQYQHFLINYVAHPEGYQTGGPLPNPTSDLFDRTVQVVLEESFNVAKAQALARYPPDGYLGHAILGATPGERLPVRQWITRWNLSADCRFGISRYGELFIVMHDPTATDAAEAPVINEVLDVLEGSFSIDVQWTSHATRIPFRAGFNYATAEWTVFRDAEDTALSEAYGRPEGIPGAIREYHFVKDSDQAKNVAEHEVQRVGHPPKVLQFETALSELVTRELGSYVTVRHFAGVGPDEARLCQIEELTIAPGTRRLRVRALDVTALVPTAATTRAGPPTRRRRHDH
jgi:hypothetical protein